MTGFNTNDKILGHNTGNVTLHILKHFYTNYVLGSYYRKLQRFTITITMTMVRSYTEDAHKGITKVA